MREYTGNEHVDGKATFFEQRNQYIKQTFNEQIDLILLGDSITEGFKPLCFGPLSKTVLNCGISGERISTINARIERDVLEFNPKQVLFMLGINDFLHFPEIEISNINQTLDQFISTYVETVEIMVTKGIKVTCCSVIKLAEIAYDEVKHVFTNYMYFNQLIDRLNSRIQAYCVDHSIDYIDYNQVLVDDYEQLRVSYTYDGIHLNEKGYFEIFKLLKAKGVL